MIVRPVLATVLIVLLSSQTVAAKRRVIRGPREKPGSTCKRNADCALLPTVCGRCPPCTPRWHPVGSNKEALRIRNLAIRARCKAPECGGCEGSNVASTKNWLGTRAACHRGRCVAEHIVTVDRHTACKVDGDCAIRPRPGCGCPACGINYHKAVNRKRADWLRKQYAIESCPPVKCAKCRQAPRWVGDKAVCRLGECVVLP